MRQLFETFLCVNYDKFLRQEGAPPLHRYDGVTGGVTPHIFYNLRRFYKELPL